MAEWSVLAPLLLCALIGIPHGAADGVLARRILWPERPVLVIVVYLLVALAVVPIWLRCPTASLIGFLIISWLHFGHGDAATIGVGGPPLLEVARALAHGGPVIVMLPLVHEEAATLFAMLGAEPELVIKLLAGPGLGIWLASLLLTLAESPARWRDGVELGAKALLVTVLPVLWAFALYFVLVHSLRHAGRLVRLLRERRRRHATLDGVEVLVITLLTWLLMALLWAFFGDGDKPLSEAAVQTVFISLAALTLPHMILVDVLLGMGREAKPSP